MSKLAPSLIERLIARTKLSPSIFILVSAIVLVLLPIVIVWIEGYWDELFSQRYWRAIFVQPVIIIYILILERVFKRMEVNVINGLRKVVRLSDEEFDRLVERTTTLNLKNELLAILVGAVLGLLVASPWDLYQDFSWLLLYLTLVNCIMYGLLGWVVYASIAGSRLPVVLYRQPLDIDIFNLKSFEPIGRQSLAISLAFMGGIAISLLFSDISAGILTIEFWVVYLILVMVAVLVFFLNMMPTHRVLSASKDEEMEIVERNLFETYQELKQHKSNGADTQLSAEQLNAWKISLELVDGAKTWPYSIETLRNLLFTVLIPGAAALIRLVAKFYFN
jgi:MFS family permease